jgi:hypothetical protein
MNLHYTLITEEWSKGYLVYDDFTCTGYEDPKTYRFETLSEAKDAIAHHMFEGELSTAGTSKSYYDDDLEIFVRYKIVGINNDNKVIPWN